MTSRPVADNIRQYSPFSQDTQTKVIKCVPISPGWRLFPVVAIRIYNRCFESTTARIWFEGWTGGGAASGVGGWVDVGGQEGMSALLAIECLKIGNI